MTTTGDSLVQDARESAAEAGLRYMTDDRPGITRRRSGHGFLYRDPAGRPIDRDTLARVRSLVIPPAWTDVWIAPDARAHIQVTGRDARRRKQYRYHPRWSAVRDQAKYDRMLEFARALPQIRRKVTADLKTTPLSRPWVLATVVRILDRTVMRVGNEEYARDNNSFGLTTLRGRHVTVTGSRVRFRFRAKSGVVQTVDVNDARLAACVQRCQDLPGQIVFQYKDPDGGIHAVDSADVNEYLREASGTDVSAKDFRTWAGTLAAARSLASQAADQSMAARKRAINGALDEVASQLGNTRAVCRKCYVHPAVLESFLKGTALPGSLENDLDTPELDPGEKALIKFIERLSRMKA